MAGGREPAPRRRLLPPEPRLRRAHHEVERRRNRAVEAAEVLAWKLGALLISLGVMHFFNMYLFFRIRRRSQLAVLPPPVAPQMRLPMPSAANPGWATRTSAGRTRAARAELAHAP